MKPNSLLTIITIITISMLPGMLLAQADFSTSLHATREGKATWYSAENGGFEALTGIPMADLPCQQCHAATFANGDPVDPETYEPGCNDCHDFAGKGSTVEQQTCLGCHSRQGAEINLSNNPNLGPLFSDVHRDRGMVCTDCHTQKEMHGDGNQYSSMLEPGATEAYCTNEGCHNVENLDDSPEHAQHLDDITCSACHAKTVVSCYNCHFETEVEADKKRFLGPPPINGFVMLINSEKHGKVTTASFQSLSYQDTTFYAVGAFNGHTVAEEGRRCDDCHATELVQNYTSTGEIVVTKWDEELKQLTNTKGVIPVPEDWKTALKLDFVTFTGDVNDPIDSPLDPTKWTFLKSGADAAHMLFATPLSEAQMVKLAMNVTSVADAGKQLPEGFRLEQNYPNPFNPTTSIRFSLPQQGRVTLAVYNLLGQEVQRVLSEASLSAGWHEVSFTASDLVSGVYVYRLSAGDFTLTRKMLLLK